MKTILCIVICLLALPFVPLRADDEDVCLAGGKHNAPVSVDPISKDEGYSAVLYNNTNGLPTSEANDIVQTAEGFIWIGSYAGLVRYDGSRFERMGPETGITSVKCLYVDSRNRVWVGTNDSGVVLIDGGQMRRWDMQDGMKSVSVRSIIEGVDGLVYVATTEGLLKIDDQYELSYVEDLRLIDAFLHELRIGADGRIYAVNNPGDVIVLKDGKIENYYRFSNSSFEGVNCILPDPENADLVYVETLDGNVYHDSLDSGFTQSEAIDISPLDQVQSFEYLDGKIWLCTRSGAGVLDDDGVHALKNVPMNNSIGHVMSDYEGNLWFTSTREGVMKIVRNRFTDLFERYSLSNTVVNSTCMYGDDLFIGTDTGLIVIDQDGIKEKVRLNETFMIDEGQVTDDLVSLLNNIRIRSIIRDSHDRLWISTWRRFGLLCFDHGDLRMFNQDDGLISSAIRSIHECDDGTILVASNGGVSVIKEDEVVATYGDKNGIVNTDILCVTQGENDDIVIGTDGAGIYIMNKTGMVKHIDHSDGLTSESVMRIKKDRKRNVYWIVTGNSLSYMTADYELKNVENFPYFNNFDLYENSKEELWILSSNGIYVAKADDILDDSIYDTLHFSMSDGLPCIATANSYSELTEEGNLYIAGTTGVAKVNIETPYADVGSLLFTVPYIEADGGKVYPDESGSFTVPSDTRRLTIYASIFNYSLVEPLISYRLEGFDESATTGYASEILPAYYTNLPGDTYHFFLELKYSMTDSSVGTVVQITKEKAIYEQVWFYVYAGLSALIMILTFVALYVDRRLKKLELKHKEESEKERIANELAMGNSIQQSMLPHVFPPFPERKEFELFASMDPAREVGGDFYDFFFVDDDHLCLVMADVSGKGIPGALFMMVSNAVIHNSTMFEMSPARIMTVANEALCSNNQTQMFVTVWLGILDVNTGKLQAANAGHEYPIIKQGDGSFEIFKDKHDFVLGGMEDLVYHEYELQLTPGSKIFLYTDGIPEATDSKNRLFGMERLVDALNKDPNAGPEELMKNVRKAVDHFVKEAEQFDDLTMMCLEYKGKQE